MLVWNRHSGCGCGSAYLERVDQTAGFVEILTTSLHTCSALGSLWSLLKGNRGGITVPCVEFFIDAALTTHMVVCVLAGLARRTPKNY